SLRLGAKGYVSVCGNIVPRHSANLYQLTAVEKNYDAGMDLFHSLLPLLDAIAGDFYVSATKCALELIGLPVGPPRAPRLGIPHEHELRLKEVLSKLGLITSKAA
ncbi:uncharacterized protein METZ01_LOCUS431628, partial [marine metagenome]